MGDLMSRNLSDMKAYTKVEIQVDMLAVYKWAYDKLEIEYIKDELTDEEISVSFNDLLNYKGDDDFANNQYERMRENVDIADNPDTFTDKLVDDLIDDHKDGITNFDEYHFQELEEFK